MGDRVVNTSLIAPAISNTQPTTRSEIVDADDPEEDIDESAGDFSIPSHSQLVSLKLNPTSRQTTPPTIKPSPIKSNSLLCCRRVFPLCGFKLRKKNRMAAATPPVGLLT